MAWSIFTQGGGDLAAKGWAESLLNEISAPNTPGNVQFVYDWEESEGGGGQFNPLNQGPVPGDPSLTSTGPQYGGGAADFVSWQAGLQGASDYLHMPAYSGVLHALQENDPVSARTALWDSSWAASHYGYGSAWSNAAVPGGTAVLPPGGSSGSGGNVQTTSILDPSSWISSIENAILGSFGVTSFKDLAIRGGLILLGGILVIVGLIALTGKGEQIINVAAPTAPKSVGGQGGGGTSSSGSTSTKPDSAADTTASNEASLEESTESVASEAATEAAMA